MGYLMIYGDPPRLSPDAHCAWRDWRAPLIGYDAAGAGLCALIAAWGGRR
jgi:hypothetical protein